MCIRDSCNSLHDETLLHGNWKVSEWKEVQSGKAISQKMDFQFDADNSYSVDYGSQKEAGSYYLSGEFLHTKETGSIEKSVRITKLTADSLVFQMNRAGSLEVITLRKS